MFAPTLRYVLKIIEPIGLVLALLTAVYTAFLFAQAKGRDFWQSPMLGLHMILHSIMAGLAIFLIAYANLSANVGFKMVLTFLAVFAFGSFRRSAGRSVFDKFQILFSDNVGIAYLFGRKSAGSD